MKGPGFWLTGLQELFFSWELLVMAGLEIQPAR